jgi:hypothetical protein
MAGYMTKQLNNVCEGSCANCAAAAIENGTLVVLNTAGDKMFLPTADTNSKFLCKEVTTIYDGMKAYRMVVMALSKLYYLVDNQADINDSAEYDATRYSTKVGAPLRAHPLQVGEEFVVTAGELTAGTQYGVLATGLIG